jgi:catechol 2,3-dioxygenase-like lactoylglutathione lyase family enzyme
MRFGYTILYVPDAEAAVAFYETAFGLERRFVHESGYAEMETGATALAFASEALASKSVKQFRRNEPAGDPAAIEVGFVTGDVAGAFAKAVAAGAVPVLEPTRKPWGQTVSYVRDLNGILVEICDEVRG